MQYENNQQTPYPLNERVGKGMFTDRESEMAFLMKWAGFVARERQKSIALVSPRRYGKTAILERFYNRLFWERDDLIPFYFELGKPPIHILKFIREYFISFLRQYLAYKIKNPELAFSELISLQDLYKLAEEAKEENVMRGIDIIPELMEQGHGAFFHVAINAPRRFAERTKENIIVMFDEFQRLNQVLYYDEDLQRKSAPMTDAFGSVVESSVAPMLIAGSQMTILAREALSKGMAGRVRQIKLKRMELDGCAELVTKLAHDQGIEMPLELSYTIARVAWRHPYYIWCLFNTNRIDGGLHNEQDVRDRLAYEIGDDEGQINGFWAEHFVENISALNEPEAKKMVWYLMREPAREVRVDEIVDELGLSITKDEANRQLRKLARGDLIKQLRLGGIYGGINDPMLRRVLKLEYSWELGNLGGSEITAQIELELAQETIAAQVEMIDTLRGELNGWVGRIAEAFIEKLMKKFFTGQTLSGEAYFNHPHEIKLSRFKRVYTTFAQTYGAVQPYQIDVYGEPEAEGDLPWIVECKNWQKPVDKPVVEHFLRAAKDLAAEKGYEQTCCWFYARSGFTGPAEALLQTEGVLYTQQDQLMAMLQDFDVVNQWWSE